MPDPLPFERLIDAQGAPTFGCFDAIPMTLGSEHFDYRNGMDNKASRLAKHFHFKQFQFVSVFTERYVIGIALADIRYLTTGFCYLYDRDHNRLIENSWLRPLGFSSQMSTSSYQGQSSIAGGALKFEFHQGQWRICVNCQSLVCELRLTPANNSLPLALCTPTGYSGWTYTQKHNALKVNGSLQVNGYQVDLRNALAGYDFSAGYMRRETSWRWASISAACGEVSLGLNLAAGVNETGGSENTLWVDGQRDLLGAAQFHFKRDDLESPWKITSQDGRINLTFEPLNLRCEKLNLGVLKSNFRQFIGNFSGEITGSDGTVHRLDQIIGLTEDHFAKW